MAFEKERQLMVLRQISNRGIKNERVLSAMETVQRHLFVEESLQDKAYDDCALPIGEGQTISQPYMVALMTELLELKGDEKVLEIGTGSGYQTAVLSLLASEVFTLERIHSLAVKAEGLLARLGYHNVHVIESDGTLGLAEQSPFDGIIVTAAAPEVTETFTEQLRMNGRLVIPAGTRHSQTLYRIKKTPSGIEEVMYTGCIFVPLIGKEGWKDE